ncbi:hypothetical protein M2459_002710 [Parabacteroides sp. PF5-5]|uniref:hypothetical protein n=1 Tax=unclassified Parabacteroides TaxID=2649774 RepID=UPI002473974D|nr:MULTISPECIES: hypothetical protein [unclassified Parabacteroides]MDH6305923.1 hypothetical protein [Parabacteroides sp. PH5-39]MDH6316862.1 hypothetical protein [Parabacteroides sp. PF5-13]MDH6320635.1 hypothetical protein [Parabacteroides sp. PH5-13]MDH6324444.1 hypothetical protein [Parabacteroides sp. PH5-8]MDH6328047.1 hypothetical protein [Parabacteroides sp. PH5-41]
MIKIEYSDNIIANKNILEGIINPHLETIKGNRKKEIELCHAGKLLMILNDNTLIHEISEQPDFILKKDGSFIGLEHQILVDVPSKIGEGTIDTVINLVEKELQKDSTLPNFLANCSMMPNIRYKLHEKKDVVTTVQKVIRTYILENRFIENPYIERISIQPHSLKAVAITDAWWQKYITPETLINAIKKKEKKISVYRLKYDIPQWLLIVIGGVGSSSYQIEDYQSFEMDFTSEFDKVFILEDFYNNLYVLK